MGWAKRLWIRLFGYKKYKLPKSTSELPEHTPVFGVCESCNGVLPYLPIQIGHHIKVTDEPYRYTLEWNRYCRECAIMLLMLVEPKDLAPKEAWMPSGGLIDNPWRKDG